MSDKPTDRQLRVAMKKAVQLGIFPKHTDAETYLKNWAAMEQLLSYILNDDAGDSVAYNQAKERFEEQRKRVEARLKRG